MGMGSRHHDLEGGIGTPAATTSKMCLATPATTTSKRDFGLPTYSCVALYENVSSIFACPSVAGLFVYIYPSQQIFSFYHSMAKS
jgi:hypothetical protein